MDGVGGLLCVTPTTVVFPPFTVYKFPLTPPIVILIGPPLELSYEHTSESNIMLLLV